MNNLKKKIAELRKDKDFADCSEEELCEVAKMEIGAKENHFVVNGDKRERKPRTTKEDKEKTFICSEIKKLIESLGYQLSNTSSSEISFDSFTVKIIRHRKKS